MTAAIDGTREGGRRITQRFERALKGEVLSQDVVAAQGNQVIAAVHHLGEHDNGQVIFGVSQRRQLSAAERADDLAMVEAGHQTHVAAAVVDHHERGIGDVQPGLVIAVHIRLHIRLHTCPHVLQAQTCPLAHPGSVGEV